jgi:hypothetical protein
MGSTQFEGNCWSVEFGRPCCDVRRGTVCAETMLEEQAEKCRGGRGLGMRGCEMLIWSVWRC